MRLPREDTLGLAGAVHIDAICRWCVTSAVLMTVLLGLGATRASGYLSRASRPVSEIEIRQEESDERQA